MQKKSSVNQRLPEIQIRYFFSVNLTVTEIDRGSIGQVRRQVSVNQTGSRTRLRGFCSNSSRNIWSASKKKTKSRWSKFLLQPRWRRIFLLFFFFIFTFFLFCSFFPWQQKAKDLLEILFSDYHHQLLKKKYLSEEEKSHQLLLV